MKGNNQVKKQKAKQKQKTNKQNRKRKPKQRDTNFNPQFKFFVLQYIHFLIDSINSISFIYYYVYGMNLSKRILLL